MNPTTSNQPPVIYNVTWTLNSPTDYSSLTGNQAGSLDPTTPADYNRLIAVTGRTAISTTVMNAGETIIINGVTVTFAAADALADIITKINAVTKFTNVIADQRVAATYLTLANTWESAGTPFYLNEGNGTALYKLGLLAETHQYYPRELGGSYTNVTANSNVMINGTTIVFGTAGNTLIASQQINAMSNLTGVGATPAGPYLQFYSKVPGQPWVINQGNAVSNLGITVGTHGGTPSTIAQSLAITQGNLRWNQMISELQTTTPVQYIGNVVKTGNQTGTVTPTTLQFTVAIAGNNQVTTVAKSSEPDSGTVFVDTAAIQRSVARALNETIVKNQMTFDPTIGQIGATASRYNPASIISVTAQALDSNVMVLGNNIAVTKVI